MKIIGILPHITQSWSKVAKQEEEYFDVRVYYYSFLFEICIKSFQVGDRANGIRVLVLSMAVVEVVLEWVASATETKFHLNNIILINMKRSIT